ncbi:MAG: ribonuclease HII [Chloroflexota bacterium]
MAATLRPSICAELDLQARGFSLVAGLDEVGRGSWAGPVVAAAVMLPLADGEALALLDGVRDSKTLPGDRRASLAAIIYEVATSVAVGRVTPPLVDRLGVARAVRLAMVRAISRLEPPPTALALDAFALPESALPQTYFPRADASCLSVAAASIVAKVYRDRTMVRYSKRFPQYYFARHKGYGTALHREALAAHGPCAIHRTSFAPVAAALR